jgi:hypothetical protein
VLEDEGRQDAGRLAELADLGRLAGLLAVAGRAEADDFRPALGGCGYEDLAVAEAVDEGLPFAAVKLAAEAAAQRPEVGKERAGVAAHHRAGEGDGRHAG